jgi:anti-sigma factor RsiW
MNRSDAGPSKDSHEQAKLSLPWLLSGTLEGEELAQVEEHVNSCPHCQADLAWERTLRAAGIPPAPAPALDPEAALQKLLPCLDQPQERPGFLSRWKDAFAANDRTWLRTVAAGQLAVIAVLALLLAQPRDVADYRTLGTPARVQANVVVVFDPGTPERELRRILQDSGARVVDGPTVTGAYVLDVPPAGAQRALRQLRGERAVTLAQPLSAESRP